MVKKLSPSVLLGLMVLPTAYLALLSLAATWRYPSLLPESLTLAHWRSALNSGSGVGRSLGFSLVLSSAVAFFVTASGFVLGKILSESPNRPRLSALAYLPYAFSPVIYAYCLQFFFLKAGLSGTSGGVALAQILLFLPFSVLFFSVHWDERLRAMERLAYTLGGSARDVWRRVLIPVSGPALLTAFFQAFLFSWFDYGLTSVVGLGRAPTLSLLVWQYIGEANPYFAALGSCLLIFPPAVLLFLQKRILFRETL